MIKIKFLLPYFCFVLFFVFLPEITSTGVLVIVAARELARHLSSFLSMPSCTGSISSVSLGKNPGELNHESSRMP